MGLEAQEIAVRLRLLGGTAFEEESAKAAASLEGIGAAGKKMNEEMEESSDGAAAGGLLGFLGNTSKTLDTIHGKLNSFSRSAQQVGRQTMLLSAGAGLILYGAVKERTESEAYFRRLEVQAGASRKQREELERAAPAFAHLGMSITEVSKALYPIQSDFKNTTKDLELLTAAAEGARIGFGSKDSVAKVLSSAVQAHFSDVHGAKEEMSLLLKTAGEGKMEFPQLVAAAETSLFPTAQAIHIPERDILSALAAASRVGNEPDKYASLLRTSLIKAITLKGQALTDAEKLGFIGGQPEVATMLTRSGGLIEMLRRIESDKEHAGSKQREAEVEMWAADMFGGSRSFGTIATLLSTLHSDEGIHKTLMGTHGAGVLNWMFGKSSDTMKAKVEDLEAEARNFLNLLGKSFGPEMLKGVGAFASVLGVAVSDFDELPGPLKEITGGFIGFVAVLSPTMFLLSGLSKGLSLTVRAFKWPLKALELFGNRTAAAGAEAAEAEGGLGGLAGMLAPGAALFLGLEGLNRALGGHKNIVSEVYSEGKKLGRETNAVGDVVNPVMELFGYRYESNAEHKARLKKEAERIGENPLGEPEKFRTAGEARQSERQSLLGSFKVDLHVDGKDFGEVTLKHMPWPEATEKVNKVNRERATSR